MKNTALSHVHKLLHAKMVDFAGFNMPVLYTGINDEHRAVREGVGIFDVSHMGEFIIKGKNALDFIQWVSSNDASKLKKGKAQYSCLPNLEGGIVDDLLVYQLADEEYLLVVNAGNIKKDWDWLLSQNHFNVEMQNISDQTALFAIQGPAAAEVLQGLTDTILQKIPYYHFSIGKLAGVPEVLISNTGYTGAGGFELYMQNEHAEKIWNAIMDAGKAYGIKPIGLGARDTLRLEKGFCLYGNDIDDTITPIEAGLGWITKFNKNFVSRDFLLQQKDEGVSKKLIGFEMVDRGIPRQHYKVKDLNGNDIGRVTSGTQSPSLGKAIGLAYINEPNFEIDSEINIEIRNSLAKARVVKLPFL